MTKQLTQDIILSCQKLTNRQPNAAEFSLKKWLEANGYCTDCDAIGGGVGYGGDLGGGNPHEILYISPTGTLISDADATRNNTTKFTRLAALTDTNKPTSFEINDDLFGLGIFKGVGINYQSGNNNFFNIVGKSLASGTEEWAAGYLDSVTGASTIVVISPTTGVLVGGNDNTNLTTAFEVNNSDTDVILTCLNGRTVVIPYNLAVGGNTGGAGFLTIAEDLDNGTNKIKIISPVTVASDKTQTLQDLTGSVALMDAANTGDFLMSNGAIQPTIGASTAAANNLTLPTDGNAFQITGNTQVNAITTSGWQDGSIVILGFTGTPTIKHNTAGGAGTEPFLLAGSADLVAANNTRLGVIRYGGFWNELFRTVA